MYILFQQSYSLSLYIWNATTAQLRESGHIMNNKSENEYRYEKIFVKTI